MRSVFDGAPITTATGFFELASWLALAPPWDEEKERLRRALATTRSDATFALSAEEEAKIQPTLEQVDTLGITNAVEYLVACRRRTS